MERWIIGERNSEGDGVSLYQFAGTAEQVKDEIVRMVISGKDEEDYEYGSEEIRQISTQLDGSLYGYANYSAYHIEYTTKKLSDIEEIRPDDSLQEYNDSERKEVITRLVVNHMEDEKMLQMMSTRELQEVCRYYGEEIRRYRSSSKSHESVYSTQRNV